MEKPAKKSRNLSVFLAFMALLGLASIAWPTTANDGFNPNANESISAIVPNWSEGKILVGGSFTSIGGVSRDHIACLNADGSVVAYFNPGANDIVYSIALQNSGLNVLVGGQFSTIGGQAISYIARLDSDGNVDTGFNPGANGHVLTIVVQGDNKILVGGEFTVIGGQSRNGLARLNSDGSLDTGFNPGTNNSVDCIAIQSDGKILIGGYFTTVGGQTRNYIARLNSDGSLDAGFNPGANDFVYTLAVQADEKILVGGNFSSINGQSRNYIARLNGDGSVDTAFNPGANSWVTGIILQADGRIMVIGNFIAIGGQNLNFIARLNLAGSVDSGFAPGANSQVFSLAIQSDGKILVGGGFTSIGGQTRNRIARLNTDGSVDTTLNPGANSYVFALAYQPDGKILAGGSFSIIGGEFRDNIARLNSDGSVETAFDPGANSTVNCIALQADGKILLGGFFTSIAGQTRNRIARLNSDGTLDIGFNPGANSTVNCIALQADGKILVGGGFTSIGGQSRSHIARLNSDGTVDAGFNPGAGWAVETIAVQPDGKILLGGGFTTVGGLTRNYIARLNSDGSVDTFDPNASKFVTAIAIQPDGKILVGGAFSTIGGASREVIARLNSDGTADPDFNPGADNAIYSIAIQVYYPFTKIVVAGNFTSIAGQSRNRIARLNEDGTLDTGFASGSGANDIVYAVTVQPDGKILAGGVFTSICGLTRNRIARLSADQAAWQVLSVVPDGSTISWTRDKSSPVIQDVTFEYSTDLSTWTPLGSATWTGFWQLNGLSLPYAQNGYVRGRGKVLGGFGNASTSMLESVRLFYNPVVLTVTSPNGGEVWTSGEIRDITWNSYDPSIDDVEIAYSTDGGASWSTITASTANDGVYSWTVPVLYYSCTNCMVMVKDPSIHYKKDKSDAVFTIVAPSLTVTSPNGGESWMVGETRAITWSSTTGIGDVLIRYTTDNWNTWTAITAGTANDGNYSWTIPDTPSTTCQVLIGEASDFWPYDSSDAVFSILTPETVSVPDTPAGPSTGVNNTSYDFSTGGSTSDLGHPIQYKIDWNDGSDSGWLAVATTSASHSWTSNGTYNVRAMARCATHTGIESPWSDTHPILISDSGSAGYYNSPSNRLIITEVNWAAASGGGNWISEVQIIDLTGGSTVQAYYNSGTTRHGPFTLWTNSGVDGHNVKFANILQTIDGLDGGPFVYYGTSGTLELITQDATHLIQASVRTYNGNFSRTFPALTDSEANTASIIIWRVLMIANISNNDAFRSSVVLFNPSADSLSVSIHLLKTDGGQIGPTITRTLAGYEMNVITTELRAYTYDNAYIVITSDSGNGRVMASGQTANNYTNDPAAHLAVQFEGGYPNSPSPTKYLTEVNWAPASGGGEWVSEVQITDIDGWSTVQVYYNSGTIRQGPFTLWANTGGYNTCTKFANILQTIDGLDSGPFVYYGTSGSLEFVTQDSGHRILASVRTYNGNFSRTFPALSDNEANTVALGRVMIIPNITNNATYRPSVVLFNPTSDSVTAELMIIGSDGIPIGPTISRTVAGYEMNVVTSEVRAYTYDSAFIRVAVASGSGRLLVSGQTANNYTNDPAAHLAVQAQ